MPPDPPPDAVFRLGLPGHPPRFFDPLDVERKLGHALPDWREKSDDLALTHKPLPPGTSADTRQRREARQLALMTELAAAASAAFDLPPVDPAAGSGFTASARVVALAAYLRFCADCLEQARPLASGGGPTASPGSAPSPPANASA